jgi:hypothetical protein
MKELAESAMRM